MKKQIVGCEAIAHRVENGYREFREVLIQLGGISQEQAEKVTNIYIKEKIAKCDFVTGRVSVKHGAFLDREVILRAAAV